MIPLKCSIKPGNLGRTEGYVIEWMINAINPNNPLGLIKFPDGRLECVSIANITLIEEPEESIEKPGTVIMNTERFMHDALRVLDKTFKRFPDNSDSRERITLLLSAYKAQGFDIDYTFSIRQNQFIFFKTKTK